MGGRVGVVLRQRAQWPAPTLGILFRPRGRPVRGLVGARHDLIDLVEDGQTWEETLELAALLKREGYTTETAADGFKALPKVDEWGPDLVLTDLHMPAMTGIELMTHIHQRDPEIPVIVMTAYAAVDTAISALKQGAADYLTKPLRIEELLLMLERAMERRRLRAETARLREIGRAHV